MGAIAYRSNRDDVSENRGAVRVSEISKGYDWVDDEQVFPINMRYVPVAYMEERKCIEAQDVGRKENVR